MFLKNYSILFISFLVLGTSMALSANSWVTCWLGLEINLMSFIPLIMKTPTFETTESAIKYFIPQAMASLLLIAAGSLDSMVTSPEFMASPNYLVSLSMLMKLGVAPLHFWFPQVMASLEWEMCIILMIWQKIAPYLILLSFSCFNLMLVTMILSGIVGAAGGLNQNNLKLILAYSSITHSSWMLGSLIVSAQMWILYYALYSLISVPLVLSFNNLNISKVGEIFSSKTSELSKYLLIFNIMSLGGLPPFLGFSAKLFAIINMISIVPLMVLTTMIMMSLLALFYYAKLFFNNSLIKAMSKKINLSASASTPGMLIILSSLANLLVPTLVLMI